MWHIGESEMRISYKRLWEVLVDQILKKKGIMEIQDLDEEEQG